jgi:hypothetical protein
MTDTIRIKRRSSGAAGAPASLASAELAFNEVDDTLYYGKGNNLGASVTNEAIAGKGAVVMLTGDQTVAGIKTFSASPLVPTVTAGDNSTKAASTAFVTTAISGLANGDMLKSIYDTDNDGTVDDAERLGGTLASAYALLNSPAFTGNPTAPTQSATDNDTSIATTAFVYAVIALLSGAANGLASLNNLGKVPNDQLPSYVDDVLEFANLAAFPGTGEQGKIYVALDTNVTYRWSGSAYVEISSGAVQSVFGRTGVVSAASGDYTSTQITNSSAVSGATVTAALNTINSFLATLGTMATQNANNVAITGGTIDNIIIDGGTF